MRKHTQTIWARLDAVRVSGRRARAVNAAKVARYRDWLEQGRVAPPVRLVRNGDFFVVRDGRHRVAAALAAGHAVIEAELHRWIAALLGRTARRLAAACPSPNAHLGDEALTAERLACNEEEWVRFPPSPSPDRSPAPLRGAMTTSLGFSFDSGRLWPTPAEPASAANATNASVVFNGSTRPLYGRGVGSTPAGGSFRPIIVASPSRRLAPVAQRI
jgi:hypothetical protein